MEILLSLSVAILAGLMMTRAVKVIKLPDVTAYLIAGVLIGPYCLGRLNIPGFGFSDFAAVERLTLVSDVALGFIAFSIGNEFKLSALRRIGRQATVIGIVQALTATVLVDLALCAVSMWTNGRLSVAQAITLGAIATATAPAATLMVVRQYKAKGPLVDLLLPIVALDDAVGLVVFAVSFGIARALRSGVFDAVSIILAPLAEIAASLLLGAALGFVLTRLERLFHSNTNRINLMIAFVFLTAALSMGELHFGTFSVGFSSLLVCMMMGTVFCNLCPLADELMEKADRWATPLNAVFFVISGAELELGVFKDVSIVLIGLLYIVMRSAGKYIGAFASARITHCAPKICRYLGITLLPQAGVALGMCLAASALGAEAVLIRNITLFAILIYELLGPLLTRRALTAAGDIQPMSDEVKNRRAAKLKAAARAK